MEITTHGFDVHGRVDGVHLFLDSSKLTYVKRGDTISISELDNKYYLVVNGEIFCEGTKDELENVVLCLAEVLTLGDPVIEILTDAEEKRGSRTPMLWNYILNI
jgi:hypothetical protein|nr:MAG TPA: hypothetical protein [Caudoviricetes sp.]